MANNSSPLPWLKFVAISARVSAQFFSYRNFVSLNISSLRLPKLTFRPGLKFGCDYMRRGTLGDFEHRNTAKNIAEHRITERKVDGTPSAQYIVLATPRLVLVERLS